MYQIAIYFATTGYSIALKSADDRLPAVIRTAEGLFYEIQDVVDVKIYKDDKVVYSCKAGQ